MYVCTREGAKRKKMSNAMSHSTLAAGERERDRGVRGGGNTFACCMKLDAICHASRIAF